MIACSEESGRLQWGHYSLRLGIKTAELVEDFIKPIHSFTLPTPRRAAHKVDALELRVGLTPFPRKSVFLQFVFALPALLLSLGPRYEVQVCAHYYHCGCWGFGLWCVL